MTQKLAKIVAIVTLALSPLIGAGTADAHSTSSSTAEFHSGGWHSGGWPGEEWHDGWRGGLYPRYNGGYYHGHYGYGPCYLTVHGTTYCY